MASRPKVRVAGTGRLAERAGEQLTLSHLVDRSTNSSSHGSAAPPDIGLVVVDEPTEVVEALAAASLAMPGARLVVMTALAGPDALVSAVAAGADGWLPPSACDHGLDEVLVRIALGETGFSRDDTALLVLALRRQLRNATTLPSEAALVSDAPTLTRREREIDEALRAGRSTREIARTLELSEVTVRWHAGRARKKVEAGAPTSAAREAATTRDAPAAAVSRGQSRHAPKIRSAASGKGLGPAEMRVALLVAEGLSNRQIAEQLFISRHTVESHLKQTFVKLGVRSRVELTRVILAASTETG